MQLKLSVFLSSSQWVFGWLVLPMAAAAAPPQAPSGVSGDAAVTRSVAAAPAYRVARSDELNFRFFYTPELNTVATVRSDGQVALPLIGELRVEGLTIAELAGLVQARLAAQVKRPQVVINVQASPSQRIFVGGEVGRAGVQPLAGPLTVLQAVMVAEGIKDTAQPRDVLVLRHAPSGEQQVVKIDLAAVMDGRDGAQDLPLAPYDVVIVPRSGIANIGLWVDQYIRRTLPFGLGFTYTINRNLQVAP